MNRIGQGFDLHRLEPGKPLYLGGVEIPSERGTIAHSDGDVVLHALIDALLGAVGGGDIGEHFPPTDPRYRDIRSEALLAIILEHLHADFPGFQVENIDCTVFLERPKLSPHKEAIRQRLAEMLELDLSQVSFKAKTAEGLPPVGTGDAVAASVVALLRLPSRR